MSNHKFVKKAIHIVSERLRLEMPAVVPLLFIKIIFNIRFSLL